MPLHAMENHFVSIQGAPALTTNPAVMLTFGFEGVRRLMRLPDTVAEPPTSGMYLIAQDRSAQSDAQPMDVENVAGSVSADTPLPAPPPIGTLQCGCCKKTAEEQSWSAPDTLMVFPAFESSCITCGSTHLCVACCRTHRVRDEPKECAGDMRTSCCACYLSMGQGSIYLRSL